MALFVFNATITHPSTHAYLKHFLSLYIYPIPLVDVKNIIWEENWTFKISFFTETPRMDIFNIIDNFRVHFLHHLCVGPDNITIFFYS